ncbi:MAG: ATP-binding cassette domain-containing protein [Solirubrobacterales bacterium]|nr:ATP-binding cassette domain-containing protein [Solirubrobacterales bacterium]MBV9806475.1 ATP-binding cassette domain-containing protein [Solirubrobacterales bacterium]
MIELVGDETRTMIKLAGAGVRLGGRRVFSDVELTVDRGQLVAVLGPNGAGKTTLMRVILGLVPLEAGSVTVLGRPPAQARPAIGYLPQRRSFDSTTRIRGVDLVRLGLDGARWGIPIPITTAARVRRRAETTRVNEVIQLVGATGFARRAIGELSGGEQQRLLIAQALIRNPQLLILDEPLDSLDLPNQAAVAGLLRRICSTEDVSVLLVAHDVNPLLGSLDQVIYLAGGRARSGTVDEVITSSTLSDLYGAPIEVLQTTDGRLVVVGQPEAPHLHGHRHELVG